MYVATARGIGLKLRCKAARRKRFETLWDEKKRRLMYYRRDKREVKELRSHPLSWKRTRRALVLAYTPSENTWKRARRIHYRRRHVVDILRMKNRHRGSGLLSPKLVEDTNVYWRVLQSTCFASGMVLCQHFLIKKATLASLPLCPAIWPSSFTIGLGALLFAQAQLYQARLHKIHEAFQIILYRTQDLMRLAMSGLTTSLDKKQFGKWLVVYAYALRGELTSSDVIHDDLCDVLAPTEFFALGESKNRVTCALQVLTDSVSKQCIDVYLASALTSALDALSHDTAKIKGLVCSSINDYSRHCQTALRLWSVAFPCLATASSGVWSVLLTAIAGVILFGAEKTIEDMGHDVESYLLPPLASYCQATKECVFQIQLDYANIQRMRPNAGFSYGSNVIPIDEFSDLPNSNNTSSS